MSEDKETDAPEKGDPGTEGGVQVESPRLAQLAGGGHGKGSLSMDLLADVALPVLDEYAKLL